MQYDGGAVGALDDDVGLGERLLEVAALVLDRIADELLACDGLLGVEHDIELIPLDHDRRQRSTRLRQRVGCDGGHRCADVAGLLLERLYVTGPHGSSYTRQRERRRQVDPLHAGVGMPRAQDGGVQHPR